ncbi:alpha-2A adrenergic receptor-like [Diadema antillarum]|uniref:alpha-2A adrenergic receptor-like n=1 Tax=Diadema antillarum TaxID=105358 RepID=UPI003A88313A
MERDIEYSRDSLVRQRTSNYKPMTTSLGSHVENMSVASAATTSDFITTSNTSTSLCLSALFDDDHDPTSLSVMVDGVALAIIFVGAFFANLMAMTTILGDRGLRSNCHNLLILNLTIMDMGVTISSMPFSIWSIYDNGILLSNNQILCKINGSGALFFTFGNFTTIMVISFDRFLTVVHSTRFPSSRRRIIGFIVFCWVVPALYVAPATFDLVSGFEFSYNTHHCSPDWGHCVYFLVWFVFIFCITIPIMTMCYVCVIRAIRQREAQLNRYVGDANDKGLGSASAAGRRMSLGGIINLAMADGVGFSKRTTAKTPTQTSSYTPDGVWIGGCSLSQNPPAEEEATVKAKKKSIGERVNSRRKSERRSKLSSTSIDRLSAEKRVTLIGLLLVMTTIVCWAPYSIIHSCFITICIPHWLGVASMWLGYVDSLLDPLIYSFMNRQVRARYRALIGCCRMDCTSRPPSRLMVSSDRSMTN